MCQAHIKLLFGLAWLWLAWQSLVLFGICVKLNYQVSLLSLGGWGKSKLKLNPAWAELGNKNGEKLLFLCWKLVFSDFVHQFLEVLSCPVNSYKSSGPFARCDRGVRYQGVFGSQTWVKTRSIWSFLFGLYMNIWLWVFGKLVTWILGYMNIWIYVIRTGICSQIPLLSKFSYYKSYMQYPD